MYGNVFTIDNDENVILYEDGDDDEKPMTTQAPQRQINAILARWYTASSITEFTACDATARYTKPLYTNDNNDAYLYHRWNSKKRKKNTSTPKPVTVGNSTNSTTTAYATAIPVKDDPSVAPTLETSCTLDTAPWTQEILILMPF